MSNATAQLHDVTLKPADFRRIKQLAHERFGLDLKDGKEALVAARLGKHLRERGFHSFAEYYDRVLSDPSGDTLIELIDSLTTNHTSFLRERAHFDFLARIVDEELRNAAMIQIWSAASSSGEEPYSMVMSLVAGSGGAPPIELGEARRRFRILATDISTRVLGIAKRGVYPAERFRELPEAWKRAFLLRGEGSSAGLLKIRPEIASLVEFARLNLIEPFVHRRMMHVIFCRNVMMYFDKATQQDIVSRLTERLAPGGYLFVGHSESLTGIEHELQYVQPAVYRRKRGGLRGS